MKLGVTEYIDCAHFLPGHHRCGSLHGHTYRIDVVIEGETKQGMVIDFEDLKMVIRDVLKDYDHRSLNDCLEYPSVENVCEMLKTRLEDRFVFRFTLRVWEGEGKWAEL